MDRRSITCAAHAGYAFVAAGVARRVARMRREIARGQGLVEYALVLVLIAVVVIGILGQLGSKTSQVFSTVNCALAGNMSSSSNGPGNSDVNNQGTQNNTTISGGCR